MKRADNKSRCQINLTVEIFGDTWSLLIIRDIAAIGRSRFGEFLESQEKISPSVLAERLTHLEQKGIIAKSPDPNDRRKTIYKLTDKGLDVLPILYEVSAFGAKHYPESIAPQSWLKAMKELDKNVVLQAWREALESGSSFTTGPNSVAKKLGL